MRLLLSFLMNTMLELAGISSLRIGLHMGLQGFDVSMSHMLDICLCIMFFCFLGGSLATITTYTFETRMDR
jgi:hypothetical protein